MIPTVDELRKSGFRVRCHHRRAYQSHMTQDGYKLMTRREFEDVESGYPDRNTYQEEVLPFCGETVVELTAPSGKTYIQSARCNEMDNYNKRLGVRICLGRIFKEINTDKDTSEAGFGVEVINRMISGIKSLLV